MDTTTTLAVTVVVAIAVVVIVAIGIVAAVRRARTAKLRGKFGSEYDRTVDEVGRPLAAAELHEREKRVGSLELRPLQAGERERFSLAWRDIQAEFVDQPIAAAIRADALLSEIMALRGYPVSDFDQRAADLSVDHGKLITNYRSAHEITLRHGRGEADTEDLRQAMIYDRDLFDELVGESAPALRRAS